MATQNPHMIVGLDIGTSKVVSIVGEVDQSGVVNIVGIGRHKSRGLKKGTVVNIESTVQSIQRAVEEAELMAGCQIHSVYTGIAGSHIRSMNSHGIVAIKDKEVYPADVDRVIDAAQAVAIPADQKILHILPQEYVIDSQEGIKDPLGMSGVRLEAKVHLVTCATNAAQNIEKCIRRCGLDVDEIILEQLASSYSVLTEDEKELIFSSTKNSTHPYSKKIYRFFKEEGLNYSIPERIEEIRGKGIHASFQLTNVHLGSKSFIEEYTGIKIPISGTKSSHVYIVIDYKFVGSFEFKNHLRTGVDKLLNKLKAAFNLYLLSGDNQKDGVWLAKYFDADKNMYFNQSPQQKLAFVASLSDNQKKVLMIGDGLNDAGALNKSHFGIALSDKTSSFSPACDAILDGNELQNIDKLIEFSKASTSIVHFSFGLSLLYNITGLSFAVTGHLSPLVAAILMPLSSITIMAFTTFATRLKARKMGLKIWA